MMLKNKMILIVFAVIFCITCSIVISPAYSEDASTRENEGAYGIDNSQISQDNTSPIVISPVYSEDASTR